MDGQIPEWTDNNSGKQRAYKSLLRTIFVRQTISEMDLLELSVDGKSEFSEGKSYRDPLSSISGTRSTLGIGQVFGLQRLFRPKNENKAFLCDIFIGHAQREQSNTGNTAMKNTFQEARTVSLNLFVLYEKKKKKNNNTDSATIVSAEYGVDIKVASPFLLIVFETLRDVFMA